MRFFLVNILICLLFFLFAGCSRKREAREYDLGKSEALIACGEALLGSSDKGSSTQHMKKILGTLKRNGGDSQTSLVQNLQLRYRRALTYQRGVKCLYDLQFNELEELLLKSEKDGDVTPELLQLRADASSLQALLLHCMHRPFKYSEDLRRSLESLLPYAEQLEGAIEYQKFVKQEEKLLKKMAQEEYERNVDDIKTKLDYAILTYGERSFDIIVPLTELHRINQNAGLFLLIGLKDRMPTVFFKEWLANGTPSEQLKKNNVKESDVEFASAMGWHGLTPNEKVSVRDYFLKIEKTQTLTGEAMRAASRQSSVVFMDVFLVWEKLLSADEKDSIVPPFMEACTALGKNDVTHVGDSSVFMELIHIPLHNATKEK